mgnify:CR=1 FL=1
MKQVTDGFYVPCSYVAILSALAEQHNIDMQPILVQYTLSLKKINTPGAVMTAKQYCKILMVTDRIVQDKSIQEFWFSFAHQLDIPSYGLLGQALQSSENFKDGIKLLVKYYQLLSCCSELTYYYQDGFLTLNIHSQGEAESRESIIRSEILITVIINAMSALLPDNGEKFRVELNYKKPDYHTLYLKNVNRNCIFSAPQLRILIPDQYLKQSCPHANPVMLNIITQQLDQALISLLGSNTITDKVTTLIASIPGDFLTLENVAQQIGISSRTLSRQLKDNNTTYQALVNKIKCQQARNLLQSTSLSIEQIATQMGFSEYTNFRRAFIGWTGMTPSKFRKQSTEHVIDPQTHCIYNYPCHPTLTLVHLA